MASEDSIFRVVMGYALFLMYGVGGLIAIGLFVVGYKDLAGLAVLYLLGVFIIPLLFRLLLHISQKQRQTPQR